MNIIWLIAIVIIAFLWLGILVFAPWELPIRLLAYFAAGTAVAGLAYVIDRST